MYGTPISASHISYLSESQETISYKMYLFKLITSIKR